MISSEGTVITLPWCCLGEQSHYCPMMPFKEQSHYYPMMSFEGTVITVPWCHSREQSHYCPMMSSEGTKSLLSHGVIRGNKVIPVPWCHLREQSHLTVPWHNLREQTHYWSILYYRIVGSTPLCYKFKLTSPSKLKHCNLWISLNVLPSK